MKVLFIIALGLMALAAARPSDDIVDFELDNQEQEQEGEPGKAVRGEYSWTAPNGEEFFVKYVADHLGYRIIDDNVVPEAPEDDLPEAEDNDDN